MYTHFTLYEARRTYDMNDRPSLTRLMRIISKKVKNTLYTYGASVCVCRQYNTYKKHKI